MPTRIVGICLVRNEENFAPWALTNVLEFCDEVLVIDNMSVDRTYGLCERIAAAHPGKVRLLRDANASGTNAYLQEFIGKDVWVFGVDGDEIYDRDGLRRFRSRVLDGEFAAHWRVLPHVANATRIDLQAGTAIAYTRAGSIGKFYNFAALKSWRPDRQRLHGPFELASGYSPSSVKLHQVEPWASSDFRCLHLCFFPRSSADGNITVRSNITDRYWHYAWRRPVFGLLWRLRMLTDRQRRYLMRRAMPIKNRNYMRGPLEELQLSGFGRPGELIGLDPEAGASEAVIARTSAARAHQPDIRSELELRFQQGSN